MQIDALPITFIVFFVWGRFLDSACIWYISFLKISFVSDQRTEDDNRSFTGNDDENPPTSGDQWQNIDRNFIPGHFPPHWPSCWDSTVGGERGNNERKRWGMPSPKTWHWKKRSRGFTSVTLRTEILGCTLYFVMYLLKIIKDLSSSLLMSVTLFSEVNISTIIVISCRIESSPRIVLPSTCLLLFCDFVLISFNILSTSSASFFTIVWSCWLQWVHMLGIVLYTFSLIIINFNALLK